MSTPQTNGSGGSVPPSPQPSSSPASEVTPIEQPAVSSQTLLVAGGVGVLAAAAAYMLYRGQQAPPPQLLWTTEELARCTRDSVPPKRVACVNVPPRLQSVLQESVKVWLRVPTTVELDFVTVTFFADDTDDTVTTLPGVVREATAFAYAELRTRAERGTGDDACPAVPDCVLVYRTVVQLNGELVDPFQTPLDLIRRANGQLFKERHCVGFTVDGRGVEVLEYDVHGVIDVRRRPPLTLEKSLSSVELLRQCCCPSTTSFAPVREGALFGGHATHEEAVPLLTPFAEGEVDHAQMEYHLDQWWRAPRTLFQRFAATLRYSRGEWGGFHPLLERSAPQTLRAALPRWVRRALRFATPNPAEAEETGGEAGQNRASSSTVVRASRPSDAVCGTFFATFLVPDNAAWIAQRDGRSEAWQQLETSAARIVEGVTGKVLSHHERSNLLVSFPYRDRLVGQCTVVGCDLTCVADHCTVLHAVEVLLAVLRMLPALGVMASRYQLLAVNVGDTTAVGPWGDLALESVLAASPSPSTPLGSRGVFPVHYDGLLPKEARLEALLGAQWPARPRETAVLKQAVCYVCDSRLDGC